MHSLFSSSIQMDIWNNFSFIQINKKSNMEAWMSSHLTLSQNGNMYL